MQAKSKIWIFVGISILVLIVFIALPMMNGNIVDTYEEKDRQTIRALSLALNMYKKDNGEYPSKLSQLVPKYARKVPLDSCFREYVYIYPGIRHKSSFDLFTPACKGKHSGVSN